MAWQGKTQRPIYRVLDADARRYQKFGDRVAVVAQLKQRGRICQIETIVSGPGEPESLAEAAGA